MFCAHCGKELTERAEFCIYCGTPIGGMVAPHEQPEYPKTGGGKAIASLVCGIVSWLTLGGLLLLPFIGLILGILGLKSNRSGIATAGICLNGTALALVLLLAVPIALLIPAVTAAREAARRAQCSINEKQIVLTFHNYYDKHGALPPLFTVDANGKPLHSWRVLILPYIEQSALYEQIRLDEPWDSDHNRQFHDQMPHVFRCPSAQSGNPHSDCSYSAIAGGSFVPAKEAESVLGLKIENFTNGLSNTIAIIEVAKPFCWMDPTADVSLEDFVQNGLDACHSNVNVHNVALMDGAVRAYTTVMSGGEKTLRQLATPAKITEK